MDKEQALRNFITTMRDAKSEYTYHAQRVVELDMATQDILHQIELGSNTDRNKWATRLAHARRDRRKSKDITVELEPFIKWLEQNEPHVKSVERLLGDVRKSKNKNIDRQYKPRVIIDLPISQDGLG